MQKDCVHSLISNFHQDFKAETIAAELVEQGNDMERILILMLGSLKRTFSNDVNSVETELSDDQNEYVIIRAEREGMYDMLPEGLFHHPTAHKTARSEKEIIVNMKRRREEEINARKFFVPFEATINYLRIQMALHENRLDKRCQYEDLVELFAGHWEIFQYLNARQANIFLHLIPVIHDIRDDHPKIREIMEMIFECDVAINLRNQLPLQPAASCLSILDDSLLGVDFTTGNLLFDEGVNEIHITIGPLDIHTFNTFLPGAINTKILQLIIDYLLPVDVDIITEFELEDAHRTFRLDDYTENSHTLLGEHTYLH